MEDILIWLKGTVRGRCKRNKVGWVEGDSTSTVEQYDLLTSSQPQKERTNHLNIQD